jgi:hypothetical protein
VGEVSGVAFVGGREKQPFDKLRAVGLGFNRFATD